MVYEHGYMYKPRVSVLEGVKVLWNYELARLTQVCKKPIQKVVF